MMKKVVYSVKKSYRDDFPSSGIGYITDTDLIAACLSKSNKMYVKIFENCLERLKPVTGKPNEFKGTYEEFYESDDGRDYQISYDIWYKLA